MVAADSLAQQVVVAAIIIYPMPEPRWNNPPDKDNDGKPIDKGDHLATTPTPVGCGSMTATSLATPIGDRPPVIISPNPPNYNGG